MVAPRLLLTSSLTTALVFGCAADDSSAPAPEPEPAGSADAGGGMSGSADAGDDKADDPATGKIIFVTSTRHTGNLGGADGADEICAERASAAGLDGTFRAWLSTPTAAASERLAMSSEPYYRTDGVLVADDWADLTDANIAAPIDRDELGNSQDGDVWTGTDSSGMTTPENCSGFTTTIGSGVCGNSGSTTSQWTDNLVPGCLTQLRLYCLEQ